jgi:hypothetical protein
MNELITKQSSVTVLEENFEMTMRGMDEWKPLITTKRIIPKRGAVLLAMELRSTVNF